MGNQSSSLHGAAAHNDLGKVEALITYQHANVNDRDKVWLERSCQFRCSL